MGLISRDRLDLETFEEPYYYEMYHSGYLKLSEYCIQMCGPQSGAGFTKCQKIGECSNDALLCAACGIMELRLQTPVPGLLQKPK